jgi:glycerol-3-phosphate dehydrogenase (NAD(P)+)
MDLDRAHSLARERGVNPFLYWIVRALLAPFFRVYFGLRRIGTEHIPSEGSVLLAANHRSFLDPFVIGTCLGRQLRFVAKSELFEKRWQARLLLALGAFPICRGESDERAIKTASVILERGGAVGIFPEGTRVRPGPLAEPKRGVGRLALETGAPVVPVAVLGTEDVRNGWRIRPRRVNIRCGRPLTFPRPLEGPATAHLAQEVTARVWSCVELQWEWLGGMPPIRSAAVIGGGSWGTAVALLLARGGAAVQLGCRTAAQATMLTTERCNERYLPGIPLPDSVSARSVAELDLGDVELVCLAVPSRALPETIALIADRLPAQAGLLLLSKGLVAPGAQLPCEHAARHAPGHPIAFLAGPAHAAEAASGEAGLVIASADDPFAHRLARLFGRAGLDCELSGDMVGVQLAGCAKNAAALAAAVALPDGANAAGVAAGGVYEECHALARAQGASPESFAGLAGAGDLVATVLASQSRNRRAGELLAEGASSSAIEAELGQVAEALDLVPLLAAAMREAGIKAAATTALALLIKAQDEGAGLPDEAEPAAVPARIHVAFA